MVKAAGFSAPTTSTSREGKKAWQTLSFQDIALLKAVLTAGLYDSVGKILYTKSVDVTEKLACMVETAQGKAQVHPSSVNRDLQTYGWLLYQEKVKHSFSNPGVQFWNALTTSSHVLVGSFFSSRTSILFTFEIQMQFIKEKNNQTNKKPKVFLSQ